MVVIALDTSHMRGSASLARDGRFVAGERFGEDATHLVGLGAAVDGILRGDGLAARDIERVALVIGPGSFTGLRIALSWVKGLHAALGVDVVTIGTLELLALPHFVRASRVCSMIDARRGEIYGALYETDGPESLRARELMAPRALPPQEFLDALPGSTAPALFVGTGAAAAVELLDARGIPADARIDKDPDVYPSTPHLAVIAHRLTPLAHESIGALEPDYLRPPAAERFPLGPVSP